MILGSTVSDRPAAPVESPTLDDLFCRAAARRPSAIALVDPPNRADFAEGPPRRLTYAEADQAIEALAARLRGFGLGTDAVVGIALPNTVESVLAILAVLRAGMIAAPLPLLWRRAEMVQALDRVGAKLIVTCSPVDGVDLCALAMQVAAELFPIRYLCAFGKDLPDGVVALDNLPPPATKDDPPDVTALDVAIVTFDITPEGMVPVARNHAQWIAAGLVPMLEAGIGPAANILGTCALTSFSAIALQIVPWLLSGGTLSLHHGFDADALATQARDQACDTMVVPGPLVPALASAGLFDQPSLRNVLAAWRAPERLAGSPAWEEAAVLIDVPAFGEIGLIGLRRGPDGHATALPARQAAAAPGPALAAGLVEVARTEAGTLSLRGSLVPYLPFPPGTETLPQPCLRAGETGFVDTGYACRHDPVAGTLQVTAPPAGLVTVGGQRFVLGDLETLVRSVAGDAAITALPDALAGHRLAGIAADAEAAQAALEASGAHALVVGAFSDRRVFSAVQAGREATAWRFSRPHPSVLTRR